MHTHIHAHTHTCTCTHIHARTNTHTDIHAHMHIHTRTHIHARTHAHSYMHAHTCTHAQKAAQVPFVISVRKFALAWCWVSICHGQILCGQRAFAESDLALAFQFFSSSLPLTSSSPPPHHLQTVLTFRCRNRGGLCCAVARQPGGSVSPFFQMPSDLRSPLRGCQ